MILTPYLEELQVELYERSVVVQKHCLSAVVQLSTSERRRASAGALSRLPQIRPRLLPVTSYIQTVKVKVVTVELDSGNSPIIPVRFLFYTTCPAARLQPNAWIWKSRWFSPPTPSPQLHYFCRRHILLNVGYSSSRSRGISVTVIGP